MINTREELSAMRRRLSAMHEEQLRDIAMDIGLDTFVGSKAPRSEIARDIVQFANSSEVNWQWLLRELEERYTTLLSSDGKMLLSLAMEAKLYGILRDVWQAQPIWVKTAVAVATKNIFLDRDYLDNSLKNILAPLINLPQQAQEPLDPTTLPLTYFVIVLSEIAEKKGDSRISEALIEWLGELLDGTGMNTVAIIGTRPDLHLPRQCEWAPAVEIAWNPDVFSRSPEVYIRWAGLRQRVEFPVSSASRRMQATHACELIDQDERYSRIDIDHVEVSVSKESISVPWELKNEPSVADDQVEWPKWPVTVRLCKSCGSTSRVDHDGKVLDKATVRSSLDEDELVSIAITDGFFIALEHANDDKTFTAFFVAAKKVSAAIWSRSKIDVNKHQLVKDIIHGKTLYELPATIQRARCDCSRNSIWRQTVLFYDPNLPPFEFSISSDNEQDRELFLHFQMTNESLL